MTQGIELIFVARTESNISFCVKNSVRDIFYSCIIGDINVTLKSSKCPEWDSDFSYVLFLQGSNVEEDDRVIEVPRKYFKYILFAILQYNISVNVTSNAWINTYKFKCNKCGGIKLVSYFHQKYFDYCVDCIDKLKSCKHCGKLGASHQFGEECYCDNCVTKNSFCQICEKDREITREKEIQVGDNYHGSNTLIHSCSECWNKSIDMGIENHYHYKPEEFNFLDYDFKTKQVIKVNTPKNNKLYMGTEIESMFKNKQHVNVVLGRILKINEKYSDCVLLYAKHDGTIPEPGSELVTHPMTLNMFRSLTWLEIFRNIVKPNTHGIGGHIHINKNAFISPLHVYKFCKFIRTNIDYIQWIAERLLQSQWCKAKSYNGKVTQIAKKFIANRNTDRYEMINFTAHTIELRFFWSPFNTGMLLKNVEFVDALYNYSRDAKLHFDYKEFEDFVDQHSIKYPYLYNFILKRDNSRVFKTNPEIADVVLRQRPVPEPSVGEEWRSVGEEWRQFVTFSTATLNTLSSDDVPASPRLECRWCGESIEPDCEWIHEGSYYHDECYDDMMGDIEDYPEEDFDPTD